MNGICMENDQMATRPKSRFVFTVTGGWSIIRDSYDHYWLVVWKLMVNIC